MPLPEEFNWQLSPGGPMGLVGTSAAMDAVFRWLAKAAQLASPVVIQGEPGVGKVLAARVMHGLSDRRLGAFTVLDSAGLTGAELEQVLRRELEAAVPGTLVLR